MALFLSLGAVGIVGVANPETWSSLYVPFAAEGFLRWAVAPLLAAAMALIVVGGIVQGLVHRKHGDV